MLVVLALVASSSVSAQIVPGAGISGVRIGDKLDQVRKRLGRPNKVKPPAWVYGGSLRGEVEFDHRRRVRDIWTASPRQHTRRGIGPGSSLGAARRAYPRLRCRRSGGRRQWKRCGLRHQGRGREVVTDFLFRGRLRIVDVHLVPKREGTPTPK